MLKRFTCLVFALVMLFVFAACAGQGAAESEEKTVIAKVYDHEITRQQAYIALASYVGNYNMTMEEIEQEPELQNKLVNDFLTEMIMDYALAENAPRYGYVFDDVEQQAFEASFTDFLYELDELNKADALEEGIPEDAFEDNKDAFRRKYFDALGYDSEEAYKEYRRAAYIADRVEELISASVTVDEDAVRAYYDNLIEAGETSMATSYTFSLSNPAITLYCEDGYRYVKCLLLSFPSASILTNAEYYTNGENDKLQSSINRDVMYMQDKIDEIRARIEAGEDFDKLIEEYGEDTGMKVEPYKSRGYIVVAGDSSVPDTYREACESLADTQAVAECATYKGYWFLQATEIVEEGPMPFEEIKTKMTNELTAMKKHLQYTETTEALLAELTESGDVVFDIEKYYA